MAAVDSCGYSDAHAAAPPPLAAGVSPTQGCAGARADAQAREGRGTARMTTPTKYAQMPVAATPEPVLVESERLAIDLHNAFSLFGGGCSETSSSTTCSPRSEGSSDSGTSPRVSSRNAHRKPYRISRFAAELVETPSAAFGADDRHVGLKRGTSSELDLHRASRTTVRGAAANALRPPRSPSCPVRPTHGASHNARRKLPFN